MTTQARAALDWAFRDHKTGRIVVAQFPNIPLAVWLAATAARWLIDPVGHWRTALSVVGTVALAVWAIDEVARGVNPWRRSLGLVVLGALAAKLRD
jgi:hypothetical protein